MDMGPRLFFGSLGSTAGELRLLVAKLVLDVSKSFSAEAFPELLICSDRDNGNPVAVPFISFTIACEAYVVTKATCGPSPVSCPIGFRSRMRSLSRVTPQL